MNGYRVDAGEGPLDRGALGGVKHAAHAVVAPAIAGIEGGDGHLDLGIPATCIGVATDAERVGRASAGEVVQGRGAGEVDRGGAVQLRRGLSFHRPTRKAGQEQERGGGYDAVPPKVHAARAAIFRIATVFCALRRRGSSPPGSRRC